MPSFLDTLQEKYTPVQSIDASGLNCPLPLLKLKQALNQSSSCDYIYIITTDTNSPIDIKRYCEKAGHKVCEKLADTQLKEMTHLIIQKQP